jgi:hypothetical protein
MAKSKKNYIGLELDRYAEKIKEFQDYLEMNPVGLLQDPKTRITEISMQINMMERLGNMLANLNTLKEGKAEEDKRLRGGVEKNMLWNEEEQE